MVCMPLESIDHRMDTKDMDCGNTAELFSTVLPVVAVVTPHKMLTSPDELLGLMYQAS